jgi:predicted ATPase/class 3 adenylate cyclase
MTDLPTGTLTFLFTDIEGSTRLLQSLGDAWGRTLGDHHRLLRAAVAEHGGTEVSTEGDSFFVVFPTAASAIAAAVASQRAISHHPWPPGDEVRVRMGLHTGTASIESGSYTSLDVHRAARIMSAGHGGQVLLSAAAAALVVDGLPDGSKLRDLGEHHLKDLGRPERVFQLAHPHLADSFPPLVTRSQPRSRLPDQPSGFVGREAELQKIGERLQDDSVRLLTLTGPGGIGKTRLSLRAAADAIDDFEDGVFFVDLSAVRDTESVLAAIAAAMGFHDTGDESRLDQLAGQVGEHRVLLVLDNFEQVGVAAPTVAQLLHDCPRLKLLVTSREALHVGGEQLFAVPPLSLPSAAGRDASAEELGRYEAIQLFVARARAVKPDFRLTDDNAAAIAEICLRLDGLPLAVELATARINLFSPEALRDRLDRRLQLLGSGARDAPARQQTLRATIEWSYELLEPGEQRLFELLSAFSGAAFDAVEAVAGNVNGRSGTQIDTLDVLASLVDKSLLRLADPVDGEARLVMLETIREYAADRLDDHAEFSAAARRAHAVYFADFARRQWEDLTGDRRDAALAAMTANLENLRLAWRHWMGERDLDQLDKLLESLWLLYDAQGRYQATIDLASEMLDVLSSAPATPERALQELTIRTGRARAQMALHGYTEQVEQDYAGALELFEGKRDLPQLFPVLRGLASFYNYRADFEKSVEVGREILRLADAQDDPAMRVDGHLVVGASIGFRDDLQGGLDHLERGIAIFEAQRHHAPSRFRLGANPGVISYTTSALTLWQLGFPDRAVERAHRAVTLANELRHPFTMAYALFHTGFLHLWRREPELVRDRAVGVVDVADEYDLQIWRALGTILLGAAKTGLGHIEEGEAGIQQGIALYQGLKTPPVFWPLLLYVRAGAAARAGSPAEGLDFIDEAIEVAGEVGTLRPEFYRQKGELLLALPDRGDGTEWLQRAFDTAAGLDARMSQLRAAIELCRADRERGIEQLRSTYETFTEGFDTPDLSEAAELLA